MKNLKEQISLIIAIIAFLLSGFTFYLTYFQAPEIDFEAGERFERYYNMETNTFNQMLIPFSFVNHSNNAGSIRNIELLLYKESESEIVDTLKWDVFYAEESIQDTAIKKFKIHNIFNVPLSKVHIFTIPPKSIDDRYIHFSSQGKINVSNTIYIMRIKVYNNYSQDPIIKKYKFKYNSLIEGKLKFINNEKN